MKGGDNEFEMEIIRICLSLLFFTTDFSPVTKRGFEGNIYNSSVLTKRGMR